MLAPTDNYSKLLIGLQRLAGSWGDRLARAQAGEMFEFTSNTSCPTEKTHIGGETVRAPAPFSGLFEHDLGG